MAAGPAKGATELAGSLSPLWAGAGGCLRPTSPSAVGGRGRCGLGRFMGAHADRPPSDAAAVPQPPRFHPAPRAVDGRPCPPPPPQARKQNTHREYADYVGTSQDRQGFSAGSMDLLQGFSTAGRARTEKGGGGGGWEKAGWAAEKKIEEGRLKGGGEQRLCLGTNNNNIHVKSPIYWGIYPTTTWTKC